MKKSNLFKQILAYTLVLSVIFSQIVFSFGTSAAENTPVWDGTKAESFAGGDGSAASPFLIETAEQLYKMVVEHHTYDTSYGKYFKITKDIYLNDVVDGGSIVDLWGKKNWLEGYGDTIATASKANSFNGTLDGNGHTIYGLYADGSEIKGSSLGLFPAISDSADIKNLNFNNVLITGGSGNAGSIAGSAYWKTSGKTAKITNCSVTNATIGQWENIKYVGGFVGATNDCTITFTNCYAYDLSLSNFEGSIPGGVFGTAWSSGKLYLTNCYTVGYFPAPSLVSKAICTNVYTDSAIPEGNTTANVIVLTAEQMKGESAKTNMTAFDFEWVWQTVENGYPVICENPIFVWDGTKSSTFAGGTGTASDPYLIENAEQLAYVVSTNLDDGLYFKLIKDIRINDTTKANWQETATSWVWGNIRFTGTFDGDGHTVDGLYYKGSQDKFGLFSYVGANDAGTIPAVIKNIKMTNAYVTSTAKNGVAILAGQTSAKTTFEGIYIDETCSLSATSAKGVAGVVGFGNGKTPVIIKDSAVLATIAGGSQIGAFAGAYWSNDTVTIVNSFSAVANAKLSYKALVNSSGNYCLISGDNGTTVLTADQMKGEAAKTNMSGLDFNFVWQTVENDYPVIRENPIFDWWDGTKATSFAGGDGTEASPFLIENAAQLYKMVEEYYTHAASLGKYFEITKDIYINNPGTNKTFSGAKDWLAAYGDTIATASKANSFSGTLDGGSNTIYGLYISGKKSAGLFPSITSYADIKNVSFDYAYITGGSGNAGALSGSAYWYDDYKTATITNCSVVNSTIGKGGNIAYVGGLVGHMLDCTITFTNCYAYGNSLSDWGTPGGIVGNAYASGKLYLVNCYSAGQYPVRATVNKAVCTNVYTDTARPADNTTENITVLDSAKMQGIAAKENLVGFNFNQIWQYGAEGEYPTLKANEEKAMYWNGTAADDFAGGEGTIEKPYEISTADQLFLLANAGTEETTGKYYTLTGDINISKVYEGWENDAPYSWTKKTAYLDGFGYGNSFAGTLDGAGYTVRGLYYTDEITNNGTYAYGLIPFVSANAVIKNLNVEDVAGNVTGDAYMGAVVGAAHVTETDAANALNMVQFVGVNVANSDFAILGGASRGVKFELCNADKFIGSASEKISIRNCNSEDYSYNDDVLIYNALNADGTALANVRKYFLGNISNYITDINGDSEFDIRDLVSIKKSLAMVSSDEYELVWSDEFNGDALDYSVWTANSTSMSKGTTLEYADNSTVNDGTLTLSCKDTEKTDANGDKIYSINYGLDTLNKMSFKYGRLEMRAKVPFAAGAFPSLWLTSRGAIGYETNSEYSTEIDVFEIFGNTNYEYRLTACIHKWYNENGIKTGEECSCGTSEEEGNEYYVAASDRSKLMIGSAQTAWHTFVFEWDENTMKFSVDDEVYYTANRSEMNGFDITGKQTDISGIFDQFLCIRLNNHMYTTGAGAAHKYDGSASDIDVSKLNYEIDYIRLYQKDNGEINLK